MAPYSCANASKAALSLSLRGWTIIPRRSTWPWLTGPGSADAVLRAIRSEGTKLSRAQPLHSLLLGFGQGHRWHDRGGGGLHADSLQSSLLPGCLFAGRSTPEWRGYCAISRTTTKTRLE